MHEHLCWKSASSSLKQIVSRCIKYTGTREPQSDLNLSFFEISSYTVFQIYCSFFYTLTSQLAGYLRMVTFKGSIPPHLQQRPSVVRALVEAFPSDLKLLSNPCSWKFACALTNVTVKISNAMQNHPPPPSIRTSAIL